MKRSIAALLFGFWSLLAHALTPYTTGDKVAATDLKAAIAEVERKATAAGFTVIGRHTPVGIPNYGVVVVSDDGLSAAIREIGGSAIAATALRIGVGADGSVSYTNPDYWTHAYLRKDYGRAEAAAKNAAARLAKAFGAGKPLGGDVKPDDLATYHYMIGMERFDDSSELASYKSFDQAVQMVRDNLAKGTADTAKVYEVVDADKKIAVFGVAMNGKERGEGWWVNVIGADHIAALPWEIFIVDNHAYALYGRFRTALGWPELSMGQFMKIVAHPGSTKEMLQAVAGVKH